jgi:hypothetical protein
MQRIVPRLSYERAAAAIDWPVDVFRLRGRLRHVETKGSVTDATSGGALTPSGRN